LGLAPWNGQWQNNLTDTASPQSKVEKKGEHGLKNKKKLQMDTTNI
jgi:hypothetical protein